MKKYFRVIILCICFSMLFSSAVFADDDPRLQEIIDEFNGKKAISIVGMISGNYIPILFPDSEILYFNSEADAMLTLKSGKADFMLENLAVASTLAANDSSISYIDCEVIHQDISFFLQKDSEKSAHIRTQLNKYIAEHRDGFQAIFDSWNRGLDADKYTPLDLASDGINGTIKMGTIGNLLPYVCTIGDGFGGFEVELMNDFCREYGYSLEIVILDVNACIPAVQAGKVDVVGSGYSYTDERAQSVDFADSHFSDPYVVMYYNGSRGSAFLDSLKTSFRRTFIDDDRWKSFLSGTLKTVMLIVFSAVPGTLIGMVLFIIYRKKLKLVNKIIDFIIWLSGGLPMITVLLIVYYVIFGKSDVSADFAAILSLGSIFAATVCSSLLTAVLSVGKDQSENAYSLGFSDMQSLFYFSLPQAMKQFIPNYRNALVSLIHSTSIVGFISVQELTKVSDLVRSFTFEAFFPIISTAIIYLILDWILVTLANRLGYVLDPRSRSKEQIMRKYGK